jgi:hypothetical protein
MNQPMTPRSFQSCFAFRSHAKFALNERYCCMTRFGSTALLKLLLATALTGLLIGTTFAQVTGNPLENDDDAKASELTKKYLERRAREEAYWSALKKVPNPHNAKPKDPWETMRSVPPKGQR